MIDTAVNQKIDQDLQQALAQGNQLRQIAGPFPNASTSILSTSTQLSAQLPGVRMEKVLAAVNAARRQVTGKREISNFHFSKHSVSSWGPGTNAQAVRELEAYRLKASKIFGTYRYHLNSPSAICPS